MICKICNKEFKNIKDLTKHLVNEHELSMKNVYDYFNYSFETKEATCPICGSKFIMTSRQVLGFKKNENKAIGCSAYCSKSLNMMVNGSSLSNKEVREKIKKTNLDKYGTEHALSNKKVREKIKKTNLDKYGTEYIGSVDEVRNKIKKTNLERYGVESNLSAEVTKDKIRKTNLERYGTEHIGSVKEVRERISKTNIERYGSCSSLGSREVQEKVKKTNLEKYGVENPMQSKIFQKKAQETCFEKYGVKSPLEAEEIIEKISDTNLKRYGTEHIGSVKEVREKIKKTNLERYGVEYFCQHELCNNENGKRISKLNRCFHETLLENKIENELEFIVANSGFDIKVGDTLVELDPYYTHNSTIGPFFNGREGTPKSPDYHLRKTKLANENNFECIHIFDWDSKDKIIKTLNKKEGIYARSCAIREVNKKDTREFLENYHLQGNTKSFEMSFGLYYKDELVQIMTFGKPRYNKNYEYELLRLCTKSGFYVIGGAERLLKYFEEEAKPVSLISYCDLSKFSGNVYNRLKFTLKSTSAPTRHWYNPKTKKHITENLLRQRGFDQLHGTNFGKGTSNEELMLEHGYVEIYDCGQATFIKEY